MSYLPNDLSTDVIVQLARVQQNDAALDTAISGNLTEANLNSATRIPSGSAGGPTMLANDDVEEILVLQYVFGSFIGAAAANSTGIKAHVGVGGTGAYTIQNARLDFVCTAGTPAAGNTFTVLAGAYNGTTFTTTSTIVNTTSYYTAAGNVQNSQNLTLTTATFTAPMTLIFNSTAVSGTPPTGGIVTVTMRVTRSLQ